MNFVVHKLYLKKAVTKPMRLLKVGTTGPQQPLLLLLQPKAQVHFQVPALQPSGFQWHVHTHTHTHTCTHSAYVGEFHSSWEKTHIISSNGVWFYQILKTVTVFAQLHLN